MLSQLQGKPAGLGGCPWEIREPGHDNPRAVSPKPLSLLLRGALIPAFVAQFLDFEA